VKIAQAILKANQLLYPHDKNAILVLVLPRMGTE